MGREIEKEWVGTPLDRDDVDPYLDFSHLGAKGVGYVRHRNLPKEVIDAYPTDDDDTGSSSVRATFLQACLGARPATSGRRDPRPG
jgi:hypothetical protein